MGPTYHLSRAQDKTFAWHPALMAVGFGGLMTEGMLAYFANPAYRLPQQRAVHRQWHV